MACFLGPDLLHSAGPAHSWRSQHRRGGGACLCAPRRLRVPEEDPGSSPEGGCRLELRGPSRVGSGLPWA